jgi:hypothetical protein
MTQFMPTNRSKTLHLKQKKIAKNLCRPKTLDFGSQKNEKNQGGGQQRKKRERREGRMAAPTAPAQPAETGWHLCPGCSGGIF